MTTTRYRTAGRSKRNHSRTTQQIRRSRAVMEALEERQLMSLTVELRASDGSSSATVSNGQVLTLDVLGVVTAGTAGSSDTALTTGDPTSFGINDVTGSMVSTGIYSNDVAGNMTTTVLGPFQANGWQAGTAQDLNGDGNIDVGSNDSSQIEGYFFARHGGIDTSGTVSGSSMVIKLGTVVYTVTNLHGGGETDINFVPRPTTATAISADWYDGVEYDSGGSVGQYASDRNSSFVGGTPFVIKDTALNPAPVVKTDNVSTLRNTALTVNALGNVTTSDALVASSVAVATQPTHGTVAVQTGGAILYTPNTGYTGSDSFTYHVTDSNGNTSNNGLVNVTVNAPPPPVAVADNTTTLRGQAVTINVVSNDTDAAGTITASTVALASNPTNGTAVAQGNGTILYTPTAGFVGTDTFTYTVGDSLGDTSSAGTVTVIVQTPIPTVANADTATDLEGHASTISVLTNDTQESAAIDPTTVVIGASPADGTAVPQADGTVIYTSNPGFIGTDSFTYAVNDVLGDTSNTATVTVNVTAITPPTAVADTATDEEGVASTISVLTNDVAASVPLDPTKVIIGTAPTSGTAVAQADGTIIYTSNAGFVGNDSFTYTVDDQYGDPSNIATVAVTVTAAPPPVAKSFSTPITASAGTPINVLTNVTSDVALVPSSVAVNTAPLGGTATVDPTTGAITYTPNASFVGTDTFTYTVADVNGNVSAPATITVNVGATLSSVKGGNRSITFVDATGGTETVTLNVGAAEVLFSGSGTSTLGRGGKVTITNGTNLEIASIALSSTTRASSLVVRSTANKPVTIGGISDTSPLNTINARFATVTGEVTLGGLASMTLAGLTGSTLTIGNGGSPRVALSLGTVTNSTITSAVAINSLKVTSWTNADASGDPAALTASSIGSIVSTGAFNPNTTVSPTGRTAGIASARIGGTLGGAWTDSGTAGVITAGSVDSAWTGAITGALTSLTVKSGTLASTLSAASIGTLAVTGTLSGTITAASARLIRATAGITGATLTFSASLGQVVAASLTNSNIFVGVVASSTPAATLTTISAADLGTGSITSIVLNGRTGNQFSGSTIFADKIRTLSLGSVNTDNGGTAEGVAVNTLTAATGIFGSNTVHLGHGQLISEAILQAYVAQQSITFGDFEIEIPS